MSALFAGAAFWSRDFSLGAVLLLTFLDEKSGKKACASWQNRYTV